MAKDPSAGNAPVTRTPEQSREGEIGRDRFVRGPMRYVLIISTILAVAGLVAAFVLI